MFAKDGFHKWHGNILLLEKTDTNNNNEFAYAKQFFLNKSTSKITDLGWIKASGTLFAIVPTCHQKAIAFKL